MPKNKRLKVGGKNTPYSFIGKPDDLTHGQSTLTGPQSDTYLPQHPSDETLTVDVSTPPQVDTLDDGVQITQMDGEVIVDLDPSANHFPEPTNNTSADTIDHDENLALRLEEPLLDKIATDLIDAIAEDINSREDWQKSYERAIENLGVVNEPDDGIPFDGASTVVYPLLSNGVIQFQARAMAELMPAKGGVKTIILGDPNEEKRHKAKRVEDYLNYQITIEDKPYFEEFDQSLMMLPVCGSIFRKTYWDVETDTITTRYIHPDNFIVPYTATSLQTTPRMTHKFPLCSNRMKKKMASGEYRPIRLIKPDVTMATDGGASGAPGDYSIVQEVNDDAEGLSPQLAENDYEHINYEVCVDLDLGNYDDMYGDILSDTPHDMVERAGDDGDADDDDEVDEDTDEDEETEYTPDRVNKAIPASDIRVALPYVVTIEVGSKKILAIRRNWKKDDELKLRKVSIVHFKYLPGVGFYGFGLWHMIGGLTRAATGIVRALLDSAAFATMQGGFRSSDVSSAKSGDFTITPGVWTDIDMSSEDLSKAFYTPPFKEPSQALFLLLGTLIEGGEKTASTTEAVVGQGGANTPVGTELARIEQGLKVYSGIHKRLHHALKQEYQLRAELNGEWLGDEKYPYEIEGGSRYILGSDFDGEVGIQPVSDPNISSSALKIAQAQAIMQQAELQPQLYKPYNVHKRMLEAQNVPDVDEFLIDPTKVPRLTAVAEVQALMTNRPVKAYHDQDHTAHITVITAFMEHPNFGGNPQIAEMIMPQTIALLSEHKAYEFSQLMEQSGAATVETNLQAEQGDSIQEKEISIDEERLITQTAAQSVEQFMQTPGAPLPGDGQEEQQQEDPEMIKAQAEIQRKDQESQADLQRKDQEAQADQERKQIETQAESQRKDEIAQSEAQRKAGESERAQELKVNTESQKLIQQKATEEAKLELERYKIELQIKMELDKARFMATLQALTTPQTEGGENKENANAQIADKETLKIVESYMKEVKDLLAQNQGEKTVKVLRNAQGQLEGATITPTSKSKSKTKTEKKT